MSNLQIGLIHKRLSSFSNPNTAEIKCLRWLDEFKKIGLADEEFTEWFCDKKLRGLQRRSALCYSNYIKYVFNDDDLTSSVIAYINSYCGNQKKKPNRVAKSISNDKLIELENLNDRSDPAIKQELIDWIRAGMLTGVRPGEWPDSKLLLGLDGTPLLKVPNTRKANKNPNGDSYQLAKYRSIPLGGLSNADVNAITRHLEKCILHSMSGEFQTWYKKIRLRIYNASKTLWPNDPPLNLYAARHQFAATIKVNVDDSTTKKKLMGHNNGGQDTLRHSYGAKRNGQNREIITRANKGVMRDFTEDGLDNRDDI